MKKAAACVRRRTHPERQISSSPVLRRRGLELVEIRLVRKPLGRDAPNPLTRMAPAPGFGRPPPVGLGIGSVGEGGSVGGSMI
jgi:hypothetical protein